MALDVHETRGDDQARDVEPEPGGRGAKRVRRRNPRDPSVLDRDVAVVPRRAGTIDNSAAAQHDIVRLRLGREGR
jgi:hypothetical protein